MSWPDGRILNSVDPSSCPRGLGNSKKVEVNNNTAVRTVIKRNDHIIASAAMRTCGLLTFVSAANTTRATIKTSKTTVPNRATLKSTSKPLTMTMAETTPKTVSAYFNAGTAARAVLKTVQGNNPVVSIPGPPIGDV